MIAWTLGHRVRVMGELDGGEQGLEVPVLLLALHQHFMLVLRFMVKFVVLQSQLPVGDLCGSELLSEADPLLPEQVQLFLETDDRLVLVLVPGDFT